MTSESGTTFYQMVNYGMQDKRLAGDFMVKTEWGGWEPKLSPN